MEEQEKNKQTTTEEEVELKGTLAEFRQALRDEIKTIEKKGLTSTLLKNGRKIAKSGDGFNYIFQVDYLPSIPSDTICDLIIEKIRYSVTVISFEETEIILNSKTELPPILASARLDSGSTALMRQMIKRIEENADKPNPAGLRMLPTFEDGGTGGFHKISNVNVSFNNRFKKSQKDAVNSSLSNDITYIWGPPGTGKTTVIKKIIEELFEMNRKVLVVSHTNTAVNGALDLDKDKIKKIEKNNNGYFPMLRIGTTDGIDPKYKIDYHRNIIGKELYEKEEKLKADLNDADKLISEYNTLLSKIVWINTQKVKQTRDEYEDLKSFEIEVSEEKNQRVKAKESLDKFLEDNQEVKKLNRYKKKREELIVAEKQLETKLEDKNNELKGIYSHIDIFNEEIAKFASYAVISDQLKELKPEKKLEADIDEIYISIESISNEEIELIKKKEECENVIAKKGKLSAIFSRTSIVNAENQLPSILSQINQKREILKSQEETCAELERQLSTVKTLNNELDKIGISHTESYWQKKLKTAENKVEEIKASIKELERKKSETEGALPEIDAYILKLKQYEEEQSKLVQQLEERIRSAEALEKDLRKRRGEFSKLIQKESDKAAGIFYIKDEYNDEKKITRLEENLSSFKKEVSGHSEKELNDKISVLEEQKNKLKKEIEEIEKKLAELDKEIIAKAKVIGTTLTRTYQSDLLQETKFDTVILDEASMAPIPALWCASYLAERNIVIVGDFLQLPPIVISSEKDSPIAVKWLGKDIFEQSGIQDRALKKNKIEKPVPANFIMLNEQFRMEKEIADIASDLYYGDYTNLESNDNNSEDREKLRKEFYEWCKVADRKEKSVEIIDTENLHAWVTTVPQGKGHSRLNCFSATLDVEMAFNIVSEEIEKVKLKNKPEEDPKVLIVAPYRPHVDKVKQLIKFEYEQRGFDFDPNLIQAGTIHSFQGKEAPVVIFDLVIDEPHWRANLFNNSSEAVEEQGKLFNVAITRARFKLYVVGNIKYLASHSKGAALGNFLDEILKKKHKFKVTDAKEAFPDLVYTKPTVYEGNRSIKAKHIICREDSFQDYFIRDIQNFRERLIIYSPFMTENRVSFLLPAFKDAINSGKEITVVTKSMSDRAQKETSSYTMIEKELRATGVNIVHKKGMHEKLVFIDDNAIWMGSLNSLSFTGNTGEVMQRIADKDITIEYEKILDIKSIDSSIRSDDELICPICGGEMILNEGDQGIYWKCINDDYSRNTDQQYPHDGVLRCKCGGEFEFFMKNEPRWICSKDKKHFTRIREGDLKLPNMAEKIPSDERKKVDEFFEKRRKELEEKTGKPLVGKAKTKKTEKTGEGVKKTPTSKGKTDNGEKGKKQLEKPKIKKQEFAAGAIVVHKTYGDGVIIEITDKDIRVKFGEKERKLPYPFIVKNGNLKLKGE